MQERTALDEQLTALGRIEQDLDDQVDVDRARRSREAIRQSSPKPKTRCASSRPKSPRRELEALLSGEADDNDTYLEVHAGAGGTESQDWASMLLRMYTRWAEQHGFKVEFIEETQGEEAGIKSATIEIKGRNAYGWLKTENGVHRLVRISPFDSNARRHTSFASVNVYPVVDDTIKIDIDEVRCARRHHAVGRRRRPARQQDRIGDPAHPHPDQYRRGVPDRSLAAPQSRDRPGRCCAPSSTKLELKKREEQAAADQAAKTDIGWGHQIRSYVLQPYQMVKDLRTGVSTSDTGGVLDGDIDRFTEAALAQKAFGTGPGAVEDVE